MEEELKPMAVWLEQNDPDLRVEATTTLQGMGLTPALCAEALGSRLFNPDEGVRERAARALGTMGEEAAPYAERLIEELRGPKIARRLVAAADLAILGEQVAGPHAGAMEAFLDDPDDRVHVAVAQALGKLGAAAAPVAANQVERLASRDAGTRSKAAQMLGYMGEVGGAHCDRLLGSAVRDASAQVRRSGAEALQRLQASGVALPQEQLAEWLAHRDADVRKRACEACSHMGSAAAPHCQALETLIFDKDAGVRIQAAKALATLGTEAAQAAVRVAQRLEDGDAKVQRLAAAALGLMGEVGKQELSKRLESPDDGVRHLAQLTLEGHD